MIGMVGKKSKKPVKSQKYLLLGIFSNIAVGPLGFRAELDINPEGQWNHSDRDLEAGHPDSTVMLDEQNPGPSRIVFRDESEAQVLPAPRTSTSAVVIGGIKHGNNPPSESSRQILVIAADVHTNLCASPPSEESFGDTGKEAGRPVVASKGMCRCHCVISLLFTSNSF